MKFLTKKQWYKAAAVSGIFIFIASQKVFAAGPPKPSELTNSLAIILLIIIIGLLLAIGLVAPVVISAAQLYLERIKETHDKVSSNVQKLVTLITLCFFGSVAFAADGDADKIQPVASGDLIGGLSANSFYTLVGIIGLELIVLMTLAFQLKKFIAKDKPEVVVEEAEVKEPAFLRVWKKINNFRPPHEEVAMDLGHDYDGIRELDNKLPPWWLYGFYACILFAFVYLYRFHVSHTGPSSQQEYQMAMAQADVEKEEYLKNAANKVDENTVTLLTDADALGEGRKLFGANCSPCHGAQAQGIVGPNLTDDYWLHGGGVKNIFKTIKYGVQEKGMKSWKDDFSPVQIAELASYIKSLHGSKPAGAKDPQGELYTDDTKATSDTTKDVKKDVAIK